MLKIRRIEAADWREYRHLRLQALQDSPDAFSTQFVDVKDHSDNYWQARLANLLPETDLPLFAEMDGAPVGLAWGKIETATSQQANLFHMWVAPQQRGLGIGKRLIDAVVAWAQANNATELHLSVTCGNGAAQRLYEKAGFRPLGRPQALRPNSALLEQNMVLMLHGT